MLAKVFSPISNTERTASGDLTPASSSPSLWSAEAGDYYVNILGRKHPTALLSIVASIQVRGYLMRNTSCEAPR